MCWALWQLTVDFISDLCPTGAEEKMHHVFGQSLVSVFEFKYGQGETFENLTSVGDGCHKPHKHRILQTTCTFLQIKFQSMVLPRLTSKGPQRGLFSLTIFILQ